MNLPHKILSDTLKGGNKMTFRHRIVVLRTALMGVLGLFAVTAGIASASTTTESHSLYGQCGPAVHNGSQLINAWGAMNVLNSSSARSIVQQAGWNATDGSMVSFVVQRGRQFQLATPANVADYGCQVGSMFSVGTRHYGAGEWVIGIVPDQYSPANVSSTPRAGYAKKLVWIYTVGRGSCANGFRGRVLVVMYVKVPAKAKPAPAYQPKAALKVTFLKTALVNGKKVVGLSFTIREYHGMKVVASWTVLSGQASTVKPKYVGDNFCEVLRTPWKNAKVCDKLIRSGTTLRWTNTETTATPAATKSCTGGSATGVGTAANCTAPSNSSTTTQSGTTSGQGSPVININVTPQVNVSVDQNQGQTLCGAGLVLSGNICSAPATPTPTTPAPTCTVTTANNYGGPLPCTYTKPTCSINMVQEVDPSNLMVTPQITSKTPVYVVCTAPSGHHLTIVLSAGGGTLDRNSDTEVATGSSQSMMFTYEAGTDTGTFTVSGTVTDDDGASTPVSASITIKQGAGNPG